MSIKWSTQFTGHWQHHWSWHPLIISILGGWLSLIFGLFLYASLLSWQVWQTAKNFNQDALSNKSQHAAQTVHALNVVTFQAFPSLSVWQASLEIVTTTCQLEQQFQAISDQALSGKSPSTEDPEASQKMIENFEKIKKNLTKIDEAIHKSFFLQKMLDTQQLSLTQVDNWQTQSQQVLTFLEQLFQGERTLLLLLQNSDELRATGGFMGSYLPITLKNGQLQALKVQDIYVPAGQLHNLAMAPTGLNEYLSGDGKLHLQDSNWNADFPQSATQILSYFNQVEPKNYVGVVSVNLTVLEQLLELTGPLTLTDYATPMTAENFAQLARSDREDFFPGSQAKADFLNNALFALKTQVRTLLADSPQTLLRFIWKNFQTKEIQLYFTDPEMEALLAQYHLAAQITNPATGHYYFLVESNVGINKVNRLVERDVTLTTDGQQSQLQLHFVNKNENRTTPTPNPFLLAANHSHYVNYLRLYLPAGSQILQVKDANNQPLNYQTQPFQSSTQQNFVELACLLTVWAGQEETVTITFQEPPSLANNRQFYWQKQSGVAAFPVTLHFGQNSQTILLQQDQSLMF